MLSILGQSFGFKYEGGLLRQVSDQNGALIDINGVSLTGLPTRYHVRGIGSVNLTYAAPNDPECGSHISQICKITVKDETSKVIFTEGYSYDKEGRISQIQQLDQRTDIERDQLGRVSSITNRLCKGLILTRRP